MSTPVLGTCVHLNSLSLRNQTFHFPLCSLLKLLNYSDEPEINNQTEYYIITIEKLWLVQEWSQQHCMLSRRTVNCRRPWAPLEVLLHLLTPDLLVFLDPPCPPGTLDDDMQVDKAIGNSQFPPDRSHSRDFFLAEELVYLSFLTLPITFHNGQRRHPAPGLHIGFPGFHWLHYFYHHGGVEGFVLRGRQHHHGPGHVWRAVEDLRVSEHRADAV